MIEKIKEKVNNKVFVPLTAAGVGALALAPTMALAEGESATVSGTVSTMAQTVATDGQSMITTIIPVVAPLIAAGIVAVLGFKFVKRFTSKA